MGNNNQCTLSPLTTKGAPAAEASYSHCAPFTQLFGDVGVSHREASALRVPKPEKIQLVN